MPFSTGSDIIIAVFIKRQKMYYKHDLDYKYPERSDEHMITVKHVRKINFDTSYHYLDKSFGFKFMRGIYWLLVNGIVFPLMRLSHGLKIYGKKNLKAHKAELKDGAITISNHVFYWDYLAVLKAVRPHLAYFPAWKENLEGPCGKLIRLSGGIPVPTNDIHAMHNFNLAMEEVLASGKWMHVFPEGSMWFFYPDIRPFKKAVFYYAVKFDKPIIPISMSFRKRRGFMRLFMKTPCVDLHIGEPIFPDKSLPVRDSAEKMQREAYHVMQVMNGINPCDPTYNTDQDIRNYHSTM